jgi:hypothetical protein
MKTVGQDIYSFCVISCNKIVLKMQIRELCIKLQLMYG